MAESTDFSYSNSYQKSPEYLRGYRISPSPYHHKENCCCTKYEEEKERIRDLINQLENKNEENFNLRLKVDEIEKLRVSLQEELDRLENDYTLNSQRFSNRENDLMDKVHFLEIEKKHLEERLD